MPNSITPPPKLVGEWLTEAADLHLLIPSNLDYLATRAAQWGANQELEACCEWLDTQPEWRDALRTARRPKPPSLKEQAIAALSEMSIEPCLINDVDVNAAVCAKYNTIRRALEALPND